MRNASANGEDTAFAVHVEPRMKHARKRNVPRIAGGGTKHRSNRAQEIARGAGRACQGSMRRREAQPRARNRDLPPPSPDMPQPCSSSFRNGDDVTALPSESRLTHARWHGQRDSLRQSARCGEHVFSFAAMVNESVTRPWLGLRSHAMGDTETEERFAVVAEIALSCPAGDLPGERARPAARPGERHA